VYDQKEVFGYYNRAKVLVATARHEGFANVYSQAAALGCYVVSTDVGGADVCSNDWRYGVKLEQEDREGLAKVLQGIVDGSHAIPENEAMAFEAMSYSYRVNTVLLKKMGFEAIGVTYNFLRR
jgi:glycosyltransferase involved in cell wall biosynthesis